MSRSTREFQELERFRHRQQEWLDILRRCPQADPDNVWHTLVLLDEPPIERLRRGLRRGQGRTLLGN